MNKKLIGVLVAVVVVVAGVATFLVVGGGSDNNESTVASETTRETNESSSEKKEAETSSKMPVQSVGQQPDCSLYTLEDMAGVWGVPMTDTDVDGTKVIEITGPQNYQYECDYNETDSGMGLSVSIQYKVYESEDAAKTSIANTRSGAKFGETVYFINDEVSDIADEAFFSKSANGSLNTKQEQLYARNGNVVFLMTALNLEGAPANARDKILETYRLKL